MDFADSNLSGFGGVSAIATGFSSFGGNAASNWGATSFAVASPLARLAIVLEVPRS